MKGVAGCGAMMARANHEVESVSNACVFCGILRNVHSRVLLPARGQNWTRSCGVVTRSRALFQAPTTAGVSQNDPKELKRAIWVGYGLDPREKKKERENGTGEGKNKGANFLAVRRRGGSGARRSSRGRFQRKGVRGNGSGAPRNKRNHTLTSNKLPEQQNL